MCHPGLQSSQGLMRDRTASKLNCRTIGRTQMIHFQAPFRGCGQASYPQCMETSFPSHKVFTTGQFASPEQILQARESKGWRARCKLQSFCNLMSTVTLHYFCTILIPWSWVTRSGPHSRADNYIRLWTSRVRDHWGSFQRQPTTQTKTRP